MVIVLINQERFRSLTRNSDTSALKYVIRIKLSSYSSSKLLMPKFNCSLYYHVINFVCLIIGVSELRQNIRRLETQVQYTMSQLARQVKRRDKHRHRRERQYNLITAILQASSPKRSK